jgi:hypothetical protein
MAPLDEALHPELLAPRRRRVWLMLAALVIGSAALATGAAIGVARIPHVERCEVRFRFSGDPERIDAMQRQIEELRRELERLRSARFVGLPVRANDRDILDIDLCRTTSRGPL